MPGCPCYPLSQQDSTVLWDYILRRESSGVRCAGKSGYDHRYFILWPIGISLVRFPARPNIHGGIQVDRLDYQGSE